MRPIFNHVSFIRALVHNEVTRYLTVSTRRLLELELELAGVRLLRFDAAVRVSGWVVLVHVPLQPDLSGVRVPARVGHLLRLDAARAPAAQRLRSRRRGGCPEAALLPTNGRV